MSTSSVSSEPPGVLDDGIEATDLGDLAEEVWVMESKMASLSLCVCVDV